MSASRPEALAVEGHESGFVEIVVARVLRTVRQEGAVGTDARGNERALASGPPSGVRPEGARASRARSTLRTQERAGLGLRQAFTHEAGHSGLIAGGGDAVGAGVEVRGVHGGDRFRRVQQEPRRPERVVEVEAGPLQLRGEPAVEDERAPAGEKRGERIAEHGHEPESIGYWWSRGILSPQVFSRTCAPSFSSRRVPV